jgi:WD40 repeat protein
MYRGKDNGEVKMRKIVALGLVVACSLLPLMYLQVGRAAIGGHYPLWRYDIGTRAYNIAISADGQYFVASEFFEGVVYLFQRNSSTPLWFFRTNFYNPAVAISADGSRIVVGGYRTIRFFDRASSTPIWTCATSDNIQEAVITPDGQYLAVGASDHVYLFHAASRS